MKYTVAVKRFMPTTAVYIIEADCDEEAKATALEQAQQEPRIEVVKILSCIKMD